MSTASFNHQSSFPAIVLAGGLGTRLRDVVNDLPKCMAPVNGKPFLHYLLQYLSAQGVKHVVLAVGYKREAIMQHFGAMYLNIGIQYSVEEEPLGTGGAIKQAMTLVSDGAYVLNGDTFFDIDLCALRDFYFDTTSHIALALKPMRNFSRYGSVIRQGERIVSFEEKKRLNHGLINGGAYFLHKRVMEETGEQKFSFEKDVLEKQVSSQMFCGKIFDNYFIDIGIPEDYARVQADFKTMFPCS